MSSATDPNGRSSAEIEREVEATRSNLTSTLEELRDRASPGQLFEQALDYARTSGGAELVRNLGRSVQDNPLPLVLIGAGIGWLMFTGNNRAAAAQPGPGYRADHTPRSSSRFRVYEGVEQNQVMGDYGDAPLFERASDAKDSIGERARSAAGGVGDSLASAAGQAADRASSTYNKITGAADQVVDSMQGAATTAMNRVSVAGQNARDQIDDLGTSARQGLGWLMREQPLVLGAIGVALGAAIGSLIPATRAEDRLMGETRDAAAGRAQAAVQEGYEKAKEVAGDRLEAVTAAVSEAGGQAKQQVTGNAGGQVGITLTEAAQQVRHAVREATHDVAEEARNTLAAGEAGKSNPTADSGEPRRSGMPGSEPMSTPSRSGPV
jgi:ElaB/YqjD/DUF883 family membrane-anchored ribosome-binding protein